MAAISVGKQEKGFITENQTELPKSSAAPQTVQETFFAVKGDVNCHAWRNGPNNRATLSHLLLYYPPPVKLFVVIRGGQIKKQWYTKTFSAHAEAPKQPLTFMTDSIVSHYT